METLDKLKLNQSAIIKSIKSKKDIRRRLQDIGLINDTIVKCELISPAKDPIAYRIRGGLIAIRKSDSKDIIIEPF